jgi:hypothetical protein
MSKDYFDLKKKLGVSIDREDQKKQEEDEIELFWKERMGQASIWIFALNFSNLTYTVGAIIKPLNNMHFLINILYTALSVLCLIITKLTYSDPKKRKYLIGVLYYLTFRQGIRIIDFE